MEHIYSIFRIFIIVIAVIIFFVLLLFCEYDKGKKSISTNQFVEIKEMTYDKECSHFVYDKDTRVIYFMCGGRTIEAISPLYNTDGSLRLYEEK